MLARFVRFSASTTLVFDVLSHLLYLFRKNQPVIMQILFKLLVNGCENFKLIALGKHFPREEESFIAGDFTANGFD